MQCIRYWPLRSNSYSEITNERHRPASVTFNSFIVHSKVVYLRIFVCGRKEREWIYYSEKKEKRKMDDYFRDTRSYIIFYIHIWIKHVFASFTVCGCAGVSACVCVCGVCVHNMWCVVVLSPVSFINREQHECECECVSSNICFYTLCLQIPSPPHRKQIRHKHKLALYIWNNTQKIEFVVICLFVFGWASLLLHFFWNLLKVQLNTHNSQRSFCVR